jgi:thiol:disulfide interchange protein DsbD
MKNTLKIAVLAASLALFQNTAHAAPPVVVHVTSPDTVRIAQRGTASAAVKVSIDKGYHVQAHPASADYLIATELTFKPLRGIKAGKLAYPAGAAYSLQGNDEKLSTYNGEISIQVPLRASDSVRPGDYTLEGSLRFQACDDKSCFAPATLPVSIAVHVDKRRRK